MFIRKKTVNGRQYFYLVKSVRREGIVRQKVVEYLGARMPGKKQIESIKERHKDL